MKFIFSLLVAIVVGSLSCSAADLDAVDNYSFDPVTMSALDYGVSLASATSWDTSDQTNLENIRDALVGTPAYTHSGSIYYNVDSILDWIAKISNATVSSSSTASTLLSNLEDINDWLNASDIPDYLSDLKSGLVGNSASVLWYAREIYNDTSELHNIYLSTSNTSRMSEEINDAIQNDHDSLKALLKSIWDDTDFLNSFFSDNYEVNARNPSNQLVSYTDNFRGQLGKLVNSLATDGYNVGVGNRTLYGRLKQLQLVLAPDTDLILSVNQEANREFVDNSFFSGSSGSTSLGVSDFADLADVGGTIKDSLSLAGNATIGSFTSGLAAADSAGQGWFSEETRSQLDAVSSTVTYSLRDPDPYNMAGWEDRYYWLLGDDE